MKSYTDIEQSKILADILPVESADNTWGQVITPGPLVENINELKFRHIEIQFKLYSGIGYPCWSLAALLGVLPMITKGEDTANPFIAKTPDNEYYVVYATLTKEVDNSGIYDNPIDACYEMILNLHEQNLL